MNIVKDLAGGGGGGGCGGGGGGGDQLVLPRHEGGEAR